MVILCLAALHFVLAWHAASTKSATFDEPIHTLGGILQWRFGDYRVNPEHPALWKHLAGLATTGVPFVTDLEKPAARGMLREVPLQWNWGIELLFQSGHVDGVALVDRARLVMPLFGAAVVILAGIWARGLAGEAAGMFAAALAALDPTLLAHSGLVTNDVACTATLLACFFTAWRVARRASWLNVAVFTLACGAAAATKFTALALPLMLAPVLIVRLLDRSPWQGPRVRPVTTLWGRALLLSLVIGATIPVVWLVLWASYGFRYAPTSDASLLFEKGYIRAVFAQNKLAREGLPIDHPELLASVEPDTVMNLVNLLETNRLLPQAYTHGLGFAHSASLVRGTYLDGSRSDRGTPTYFVLAWAYKTPVGVIMLAAGGLAWVVCTFRPATVTTADVSRGSAGDIAYVILPCGVVLGLAMASSLNIGIRHILPAMPMVWIGLSVMVASLLAMRWLRTIALALIALAAVETLARHPNYIAFFNWPAGREGGLDRLSDSNLDWGQDLRLLARWQRSHPDVPLYLAYFGSADPNAYGVRYIDTLPGYLFGTEPTAPDPNHPGVLAVSATLLQGTYIGEGAMRDALDRLRSSAEPFAVLGGTIYLYEFPLRLKEQSRP